MESNKPEASYSKENDENQTKESVPSKSSSSYSEMNEEQESSDLSWSEFGLNWTFGIVSAIASCILGQWIGNISPIKRNVQIDESIAYPIVTHEQIGSFWMFFISVPLPIFIIFIYMSSFNRFSYPKILMTVLGLFISDSYVYLLTNILKNLIGSLRPDFIDRCQPQPKYFFYSDEIQCLNEGTKKVDEGRRSFPSGHSSRIFSAMTYLVLVFLRDRGTDFITSIKESYQVDYLFIGIPLVIASYIGVTRITDHRHRLQDVIAGALLGSVMAIVIFHAYDIQSIVSMPTQESSGIPPSPPSSTLPDSEIFLMTTSSGP